MKVQEINQQTTVDPVLIARIKSYAAQHGILMKELYEEALTLWIAYRKESMSNGSKVIYAASPKRGKPLNLKISGALNDRIKACADQDDVSVRRLLFTSLIHYAKVHKLVDIEVDNGY